MDDIKAKQQIVEKIKSATNILVTVSNDPSVDALSAALGLTLLLDKLEKHPTAVFSGNVPPAIAFLEPEKTFDETTDSLRDFIIALDKEKADHLRYKVEGDSVKIFITPYKTTITSDDLQFSQGDFNVELVIALGVDVQEHLDNALESHGQILHDADIITLTAGEQVSNLGGIDWHDDQASSLSEMIAGLAEALKEDKKKSLLDAAIATAFLTGIVAQTDRFSNENTTAHVMTTAALLMAAGADQQLIASKLQESHEIGNLNVTKDESEEGSEDESENGSSDEQSKDIPEEPEEEAPQHKDMLSISHKSNETLEQMDKRVKAAEQEEAVVVADEALTEQTEQNEQNEHTGNTHAAGAYAVDNEDDNADDKNDEPKDEPAFEETPIHVEAPAFVAPPAPIEAPVASAAPEIIPTPAPTPEPTESESSRITTSAVQEDASAPSLGGTLNATSEQAAEDSRREEASGQNKTILSHSYLSSSPTDGPTSTTEAAGTSFVLGQNEEGAPLAPAPEPEPAPVPETFGHELVLEPLSAPAAPSPVDLGLPMPPSLPDFSAPAIPAAGSAYAFEPEPTQPEILGDILAPEPTQPFQPTQTPQPFQAPPTPPAPDDPGQFKIPGQQ